MPHPSIDRVNQYLAMKDEFSMASLNKVSLIGNLGRDPETRYFPDGTPVTNASLATSETWKDAKTGEPKESTEWHRLIFRRGLAEVAEKYLVAGSQLFVEGKLKTRKYTDKSGADRYATEIHVGELIMLGGKRKDGAGGDAPLDGARLKDAGIDDVDIPF